MKLMAQRNLFGNVEIVAQVRNTSPYDISYIVESIVKLDKNFSNPTLSTINKYHCIEYGAHSYDNLDVMASYHLRWTNAFFKRITNTNIVVLVAPRPCLIQGTKK